MLMCRFYILVFRLLKYFSLYCIEILNCENVLNVQALAEMISSPGYWNGMNTINYFMLKEKTILKSNRV